MSSFPQTVNFGGHIVITMKWQDFKATVVNKNMQIQYVNTTANAQSNDCYQIFAYDGYLVYTCLLILPTYSSQYQFDTTYTQTQNDNDCADFTTNFMSKANTSVEPKTIDGRIAIKDSVANRTTNFKLRAFSFYTSTGQSSVHNVSPLTNTDHGDVALTMYSSVGVVTLDPTQATIEHLDFMPNYNYEIIGGFIDIPTSIAGGNTNAWFISAIGVPDLPPINYGSIDFVSEVNLEAIASNGRVVSNGRAVSYLPYNYGGYPTNKIRFIFKHPIGNQQRFQIYIEHFV